jgi:hypothetical protein
MLFFFPSFLFILGALLGVNLLEEFGNFNADIIIYIYIYIYIFYFEYSPFVLLLRLR